MREEVFAQYYDTAGNYHWHGTETGEHIIKKQDNMAKTMLDIMDGKELKERKEE